MKFNKISWDGTKWACEGELNNEEAKMVIDNTDISYELYGKESVGKYRYELKEVVTWFSSFVRMCTENDQHRGKELAEAYNDMRGYQTTVTIIDLLNAFVGDVECRKIIEDTCPISYEQLQKYGWVIDYTTWEWVYSSDGGRLVYSAPYRLYN